MTRQDSGPPLQRPFDPIAHRSRSLRRPGDRNIKGYGFDFHPQVFFVSAGLVLLFILVTLVFKEPAETAFGAVQTFIADVMGWFLILCVSIYLGVAVILAFSKFGNIRLGGKDAKPEFPTFAWVAMLMSAGMGIGLMFWSVAEPIFHFQEPPRTVWDDCTVIRRRCSAGVGHYLFPLGATCLGHLRHSRFVAVFFWLQLGSAADDSLCVLSDFGRSHLRLAR